MASPSPPTLGAGLGHPAPSCKAVLLERFDMDAMTGTPKPRRPGRRSASSKAGLTFPVGRVARYLRTKIKGMRFGAGAPVYLAAVLEYMCAEVLELSGNVAHRRGRKRIIPRDINLSIRNDCELHRWCKNAILAGSGNVNNPLLVMGKNGNAYAP